MRVLHVLAETGFSGGEGQLELILRRLQQSGHSQEIVLAPGAKFAATATALGVPVHTAPLRRWWRPDLWPRLRGIYRRVRPDLIHFACGRSLLVGGLAAVGRTAAVKLTIRRIDYPIRRGLLGGARYTRLCDHVVAICDAIRDRLVAGGVAPDRITRVYDGIDPAPWLAVREQRAAALAHFGIQRDAAVISCAGVLRPRKGQAVLIDAFARFAGRRPHAVLLLAGGGSDLGLLQARVRSHGLEGRVLLPGPVRPVQNVYAASDLFCMPSFHEGLCNACLEASFAGLPQVVSDAGGNAEIVVDGATGAVVPKGDVDALAAALERYVADPGLGRRHGEAGRERSLALFTADRLGNDLEQLFTRLVAQAHVRAS